jgi:hypothetical protein
VRVIGDSIEKSRTKRKRTVEGIGFGWWRFFPVGLGPVQCNSGSFFPSTIPCIRACIANILGPYLGWAPGGRTCCPGPEPALSASRFYSFELDYC